jgi:hypothetical protein
VVFGVYGGLDVVGDVVAVFEFHQFSFGVCEGFLGLVGFFHLGEVVFVFGFSLG